MTKDIGCRVRVADKLEARDFGEAEHAKRKPGALGKVLRIGSRDDGDWRIVEHDDGTAAGYDADELTELRAPMVLDGDATFPDVTFFDGMSVEPVSPTERELFFGNFMPDTRAAMRAQVASGDYAVAMLGGKPRYVRVRPAPTAAEGDTEFNPNRYTDEERATQFEKEHAELSKCIEAAMLALDAANVPTNDIDNNATLTLAERVEWLAEEHRYLVQAREDAHKVLDAAGVLNVVMGRNSLSARVQALVAQRDSRQWGDEPKPASRPRAGGFVHKGSGSAVYDANGHRVGGTWRTGVGWGWDANQSFAPSVVYAAADLPSEADACAACLASLRTWADVEGEESDAPKASEGFGGTRVRTLGEAVDGAHVVRLALYGFADGSEVPYLEAHETHDGARAGRVMSLSAAVHLMQNASDDEVWTIGSREKAGESK